MIWNSGCLAYHDLMQWLQYTGHIHDVIIIVETRLTHDMEHVTATHYVMHSAQPHARVMVMIHKRLAPVHRVTWRVLAAGRLVHARLCGTTGHVNIVGFYQQAGQPNQVEQCLKHRAKLLAQLNHLLLECSVVQLLFLGGGFNTDPLLAPMLGMQLSRIK